MTVKGGKKSKQENTSNIYDGNIREPCNIDTFVGTCKPIMECSIAIKVVSEDIEHPPTCFWQEKTPIVCCPPTNVDIISGPKPIRALFRSGRVKKTNDMICRYEDREPFLCCGISKYQVTPEPKGCPPLPSPKLNTPVEHPAWTKCVSYQRYYNVCVAKSEDNKRFIRKNTCPKTKMGLRIIDGTPSELRQFPHMAVIGCAAVARSTDDIDISWIGGGSLISDKFILTAAHVILQTKAGVPRYALLGTLDKTKVQDGMLYNIINRIPHKEYAYMADVKKHDIALVELHESIYSSSCILEKMGKQQSKEDTIIVQNAAAGNNQSQLEEFRVHLSTINILLGVIVLVICVGAIYCGYHTYKRCLMKWISSEITRNTVRRSLFRQFQQPVLPMAAPDEAYQPGQALFSKAKRTLVPREIAARLELSCIARPRPARNLQSRYGVPKVIATDRGKEFIAATFKEALLGYGKTESSSQWLCGGTIISERYILTAGHCTSSRDFGNVTYARTALQRRTEPINSLRTYKIKNIIKHPEYNPPHRYNDIALLEVDRDMQLDQFAVPACLDLGSPNTYDRALASGWGATKNRGSNADELQKVVLEKFSTGECSELFPSMRLMVNGFDEKTQICYGDKNMSKDTCQGDSGGPLQLKHKQINCMYTVIGVTSFGRACGYIGEPGIYTRVAAYVPWIESVVWP
ncbi:unnamed protein product, partial [Brenthis ino]